MKKNRKGFTLAELLIVVAIIAVLVAIAIPVFTTQLEKSREATDLANARSAYAELMVAVIDGDADAESTIAGATITMGEDIDNDASSVAIELNQKVDKWTMNVEDVNIAGVASTKWSGLPSAGGTCTITYDPITQAVAVAFE